MVAVPKKKPTIQRRSAMDFLASQQPEGRKSFFALLDDVYPDPDQPRRKFHEIDGVVEQDTIEKLYELAASIAEHGLEQAISVRPHPEYPGKWMIVAGERRWRAHVLNRDRGLEGFATIEAVVTKHETMAGVRMVQLAENIFREDLTDMEIAFSLKQSLEAYPELQQKDLAEMIGKSKQWVSRMLGLLDPRYAELMEKGYITYAAILENFKSLPELSQQRLLQEARETGEKITSGKINKERDLARNNKSASTASESANSLAQTGVKTAPVATSGKQAPVVREAESPTTAAMAMQEVRMQLSQLVSLLPVLDKKKPFDASVTLSVGELRQAIRDLGSTPTRDNAMLSQQLLDVLNSKRGKK